MSIDGQSVISEATPLPPRFQPEATPATPLGDILDYIQDPEELEAVNHLQNQMNRENEPNTPAVVANVPAVPQAGVDQPIEGQPMAVEPANGVGQPPEVAPIAPAPQPQVPLDPEVTYLWNSLYAQYLRWEGAKAMDRSKPDAKRIWKDSVFKARHAWKSLLKYRYTDEGQATEVSKWLRPGTQRWRPLWINPFEFRELTDEEIRKLQSHQCDRPHLTKTKHSGNRSNHWENNRKKRSTISNSEAIMKAQVAMGHYFIRPPVSLKTFGLYPKKKSKHAGYSPKTGTQTLPDPSDTSEVTFEKKKRL